MASSIRISILIFYKYFLQLDERCQSCEDLLFVLFSSFCLFCLKFVKDTLKAKEFISLVQCFLTGCQTETFYHSEPGAKQVGVPVEHVQ